MHRFWALPLRRQLFLAILLLLVPVLGAAVWSGLSAYRERLQELRDQTRVVALTTASAIDRELTGYDRMARNVSANAVLLGFDADGVSQMLRPQLDQRPSLIEVVMAKRDGTLVAQESGSTAISADWRVLASQVTGTGRRVLSGMQVSPSGLHYVTLAYPVTDANGETVAVLVCYVNPQRMQDLFGVLPLPSGSVVAVTDPDNRVLASSLNPDRYVGRVQDLGQSAEQPRPTTELVALDGTRRTYGGAPIGGGPWLVSVGIPTKVALDRAMSLWRRSFTILVLGLAGWLLVALVFSRRLTQSLGHLDRASQRIAAGDFSPIERKPMPTREFEELQRAFDQMLRRFNETRTALDAQMGEERRIRQELQSLQRQVIRQERLTAVGQLVSGVAHEINNPLQAILGFAELLQMQSDVPESVKSDLVLIQKESARACGIIRNLALFARQQTGDAAPVRLADVSRSVAELRQRRLETEGIELRIEDTSRNHVLAVLTELQQVVLNFVVNAEQAIVSSGRQPGRITIRTRDDKDRVVLEVEDTGPGIPQDDEAKLFQPFFTTKPVGQGTGLGLSVSYGIIDSLGGHIGYRGAPAGGAVFYFDLPAASVHVG
jgi:C4-dicarboxylate-specific signal transduction histidine kinase